MLINILFFRELYFRKNNGVCEHDDCQVQLEASSGLSRTQFFDENKNKFEWILFSVSSMDRWNCSSRSQAVAWKRLWVKMGKYVSIIFSTKKIQKKIKKSITGEFVRMGVVRLSLKTVINSVDGQFALTLWHSSSPSAKENILFPSNKMSLSEIMETKASPEKIIY